MRNELIRRAIPTIGNFIGVVRQSRGFAEEKGRVKRKESPAEVADENAKILLGKNKILKMQNACYDSGNE